MRKRKTNKNKGAERRASERERERDRVREIKRRKLYAVGRESCGIARIMSRRKQATPRSLRRKYTDFIHYSYFIPIKHVVFNYRVARNRSIIRTCTVLAFIVTSSEHAIDMYIR